MLNSLALIFLLSIILSYLCSKIKLPSILGMILAGIILGPHVLNAIDSSILNISDDLREIALIVILTRAGLSLNLSELKKVGRPAFLMCFVPACFEILGVVLIAPKLLGISVIEAALIGAIIAAVSPAIVVPRMLKLIEEGYGKKNSVPQIILAGASIDDVFVIVLFTSFLSLAGGNSVSPLSLIQIPISILTGVAFGILIGNAFVKFFKKVHLRDSIKIIIIFSISFLLIGFEHKIEKIIPYSSLISIMTTGIIINKKHADLAKRLSERYNKIWVISEIILFVLVGTKVDINYIALTGVVGVFVILGAVFVRLIGVSLCLIKTKLTFKERLFCMFSYIPKATVQAGIGGVPLAMGLDCGNLALTMAVLSILITAPLGAIIIDQIYKKFLTKE